MLASSKPKIPPSSGGTVLVRQAQPKYNIKGRKLPKERKDNQKDVPIPNDKAEKAIRCDETIKGVTNQNFPSIMDNAVAKTAKPVAVVGATCQGKPSLTTQTATQASPRFSNYSSSFQPNLEFTGSKNNSEGSNAISDSHKIPQILPSSSTNELPEKCANCDNTSNSMAPQSSSNLNPVPKRDSSLSETERLSGPLVLPSAQTIATQLIERTDASRKQLEEVQAERDRLNRDLDVQLKVNSELKKLLIASVGEDLGERVERLARDRAELSQDMSGYSKKISEDYENLDKVSIQADMWRSKYLASRVMVEELGNARAYYALQCHDAQDGLHKLLNERHELRTNLLETHRVLQQVKSAFDPLNSQRSAILPSTNVLDLARSSQHLADAVRFRLLPAHVAVPMGQEGDADPWEKSVTRAEQFAHEILTRPIEPAGSLQSGSSNLLPVNNGQQFALTNPIDRHPDTRHENLTFNCCIHCKGDISVI